MANILLVFFTIWLPTPKQASRPLAAALIYVCDPLPDGPCTAVGNDALDLRLDCEPGPSARALFIGVI